MTLVLASTSPQRRAILEQLAIPFELVAPGFVEAADGDPLEHAAGKARSVDGAGRPVLGVDTVVVCGGRLIGKPRDAADAAQMLETLAGRTHEVVSGLCLRTPEWEELHSETTTVTFRPLSLVERIDGDYLNVVGLPAALLVRLLAARLPGAYGFG